MPGSSNAPDAQAPSPLDPESAIIVPEDWTQELRLDSYFDLSRPLEIDLGCGRGDFLVSRATANPAINYLGIDRFLRRLRKASKRILKAGVSNARLLRVEAAYAFEHLLPESSTQAVYCFFPDPWPKRRHHDRRLLDTEFLGLLHRVLKGNGTLHIATDHADYAEAIDKVFARHTQFAGVTPPFVTEPHERTQFEMEFLAQGLPIHRRSFVART